MCGDREDEKVVHMSYSLNSLKGDYIGDYDYSLDSAKGDYIGDYDRGIKFRLWLTWSVLFGVYGFKA